MIDINNIPEKEAHLLLIQVAGAYITAKHAIRIDNDNAISLFKALEEIFEDKREPIKIEGGRPR